MRGLHRHVSACAAVLGILAGAVLTRSTRASAQAAPAAPQSSVQEIAYVGPGSCSAVACHGAIRPAPGARILQNEYNTWVALDRHARATEIESERGLPQREQRGRHHRPQPDVSPRHDHQAWLERADHAVHEQYTKDDITSYFAYAKQFTLCDHYFTDVAGPSTPNHLMLIAADSPLINNPHHRDPIELQPPFDLPSLPSRLEGAGPLRDESPIRSRPCGHPPTWRPWTTSTRCYWRSRCPRWARPSTARSATGRSPSPVPSDSIKAAPALLPGPPRRAVAVTAKASIE